MITVITVIVITIIMITIIIMMIVTVIYSYATIHRGPAPGRPGWSGADKCPQNTDSNVSDLDTAWIQLGYMAGAPGLWAAPFHAPVLALRVVWRVVSAGLRAPKTPIYGRFLAFWHMSTYQS